VHRLLAATGRGVTGIRNRALIVVFYRCGLRCAEALALLPRDVDTAVGTLSVRHGKGDTRRTVGLDRETCRSLDAWYVARATVLQSPVSRDTPLFCSLTGRPLQTSYVRQLMPRLGRRAGIEKRVHAHGLRATMAVELQRELNPLIIIQGALGHVHASTTSVYLDHLEPREVVDAMRRRVSSVTEPSTGTLRRARRADAATGAHTKDRGTPTDDQPQTLPRRARRKTVAGAKQRRGPKTRRR